MNYMFQNAIVFNQDLSKWDVSKVVSISFFDYYADKWDPAKKNKFK